MKTAEYTAFPVLPACLPPDALESCRLDVLQNLPDSGVFMQEGFMRISDQCCDADSYVHIGYQCAKLGACFDVLRPVGATYWFSIPFRFDSQNIEILFWLQSAMLAGLALLSLLVFRAASRFWHGPANAVSLAGWAAWLLMVGVWIFYLWPTFFHTLSDTPATLFFVAGILFLLLAFFRDRSALYFLGGISFGISAIIRSAYFNPVALAVLFFLLYYFFHFFIRKKRNDAIDFSYYKKSLLLLSCIIPLSLQYFSNWKHYGYFAFVSPEYSKVATELHLESVAGGYDTTLPQGWYYWSPVCSNASGLKKDVMAGNLSGLSCMFSDRIRFYFGSYAPDTYLGEKDRDFMDYRFAEQVGLKNEWGTHQMDVAFSSALSPLGEKNVSRLTPHALEGGVPPGFPLSGSDYFAQEYSLIPLPVGGYAISLWLWSDEQASPSLKITNLSITDSGEIKEIPVLERKFSLGNKSEKFSLLFENRNMGYLVARLGYFGVDKDVPLKSFYAWGVKLEAAEEAIGYTRGLVTGMGRVGVPDSIAYDRTFSISLLLANLGAMILAVTVLWLYWQKTRAPVIVFIATGFLGLCAQSLLVIPEQRFVQPVLMVGWMLCLLLVSSHLRIVRSSSSTVKS